MLNFKVFFVVCAIFSTSLATFGSDLEEDNFRKLSDENDEGRIGDEVDEAAHGAKIWGESEKNCFEIIFLISLNVLQAKKLKIFRTRILTSLKN